MVAGDRLCCLTKHRAETRADVIHDLGRVRHDAVAKAGMLYVCVEGLAQPGGVDCRIACVRVLERRRNINAAMAGAMVRVHTCRCKAWVFACLACLGKA